MLRRNMIPVATAVIAGLSLAGCSGSSNWDPTDLVTGELFFAKPKLQGERKAVFPEGVPGVPEGVPKDMIKGSQQATLEQAPEPEPAPKPAAKPAAPKPRTASTRPQQPQQPARQATTAPRPAPQQPANQADSDWPDPNGARRPSQPAQSNSAQSNSAQSPVQANWPPPDANTFSR